MYGMEIPIFVDFSGLCSQYFQNGPKTPYSPHFY